MASKPVIGILALQGGFAKHEEAVTRAGGLPRLIKYPQELAGVQALILPGGESTTLTKLMTGGDFSRSILALAERAPIFGTCAGLILLSSRVDDDRVHPLGLLNVAVERNAYGSQIESFQTELVCTLDYPLPEKIPAVFIRAPRITAVNAGVEILARDGETPVLVRQGRVLGASFHPELTSSIRIHQFLISMI